LGEVLKLREIKAGLAHLPLSPLMFVRSRKNNWASAWHGKGSERQNVAQMHAYVCPIRITDCSQACTTEIQVLRKQREEDREFTASLDYTETPHLQKTRSEDLNQ
jgi:hypothetical protein